MIETIFEWLFRNNFEYFAITAGIVISILIILGKIFYWEIILLFDAERTKFGSDAHSYISNNCKNLGMLERYAKYEFCQLFLFVF